MDAEQIARAREQIAQRLVPTPVLKMNSDRWDGILPEGSTCWMKLELFQQSGSFKARGVLLGISGMTDAERAAGVAAASGGNHAMAVAWGAAAAQVSAKIAIPKAADPLRIDACRATGAEVVRCEDIRAAFEAAERWAADEGRTMMHPFEGEHMLRGSATCGAEFMEQCPDLDAMIVPVGGGGLIAGMAAAAKLANPKLAVFGVEPVGANSLQRSFERGAPVVLDSIDTIADSLASPKAMPLSFDLAQKNVDEIVTVTDDDMRASMRVYQNVLRLVAEPACAASLAALSGPLRDRLAGRSVGIIACGSNVSLERYAHLLGG